MSARHPKRHLIIAERLFESVVSFKELERRIAALETEKDRGDAFEVFVEAYLATQKSQQAREVWPGSTAPPTLSKRLGLPVLQDMGSDGVYTTTDGRNYVY